LDNLAGGCAAEATASEIAFDDGSLVWEIRHRVDDDELRGVATEVRVNQISERSTGRRTDFKMRALEWLGEHSPQQGGAFVNGGFCVPHGKQPPLQLLEIIMKEAPEQWAYF
jgi:hypothetical protein